MKIERAVTRIDTPEGQKHQSQFCVDVSPREWLLMAMVPAVWFGDDLLDVIALVQALG